MKKRIPALILCAVCLFSLLPHQTFAEGRNISVGSYITFGTYEQDNNRYNGKEPIEWLVLDYDAGSGTALVISRYGLEAKQFHDYPCYQTWQNSSIRSWLNTTFLREAFSEQEQAQILVSYLKTPDYSSFDGGRDTEDLIFLLSREEAKLYFSSNADRFMYPSKYAAACGAALYSKWDNHGFWWLRSPGKDGLVSFVTASGEIGVDGNLYSNSGCVRPAMYIRLTGSGS